MSRPQISADEFARMFRYLGAAEMSRTTGMSLRGIYARRDRLERHIREQITSPTLGKPRTRFGIKHPGRLELECRNGIVLVGSDCHYWPGEPSLMHKAFVAFCKEYKPAAVILNGDVIDAATISRHPPIGWERLPSVQEEIEAAQDRLSEIEKASGRTRKIWTLGNHDARFETRLATVAPEFAKVKGIHLRDHFPLWEAGWSVFINNDVVVKHRFKGGIHAPHNNTMWAGKSVVTGHLHSAKVSPLDDYNGTRYGVDTGCIADPSHAAFLYLEDNPRNWRSAFCFLTFKDGRLMQPELVLAWDENRVQFRGELIKP